MAAGGGGQQSASTAPPSNQKRHPGGRSRHDLSCRRGRGPLGRGVGGRTTQLPYSARAPTGRGIDDDLRLAWPCAIRLGLPLQRLRSVILSWYNDGTGELYIHYLAPVRTFGPQPSQSPPVLPYGPKAQPRPHILVPGQIRVVGA